ncbi:MAG TPA: rhomboid family intramembrane serine protease [Solirubrobacteraceae bacterium]|nr:rhomboid family intramembrane serine protease [Solirubrobacteraceae bacterium]
MRNTIRQPQVTYALIAINLVAFLAEGNLSFSSTTAGNSLYQKGALLGSSPAGDGVAYGEWWRVVTGGFLHANVLHIAFNMYLLYVLGQMLEPAIGSLKFGLVYAASLLSGSFGALLVTPHAFTVGASGAVFGLMGAVAMEMRARQVSIMESGIGGLILINLAFSFVLSGISIGGHIGGLIGGGLAALAIQTADRYRSQALALIGCVVIAAAAFAGAIAASKSSEDAVPATGQSIFITPGQ